MAMSLSFQETYDYTETPQNFEINQSVSNYSSVSGERIHLFADKIRIPENNNYISRPRLVELLKKSSNQIGATLVTGRAGTGKTALAAEFAALYNRVAWYQIGSAETDWNLFSRYFAAIFEVEYAELKDVAGQIELFVENLLAIITPQNGKPLLIVLDDIHNIFDAQWFKEFFVALLYGITPDIHLVLLSRTKPPQPLWRVRSKQVLGVIDEKLLTFTADEINQFLKSNRIAESLVKKAGNKSFGRISHLKQFIKRAAKQVRKKQTGMT